MQIANSNYFHMLAMFTLPVLISCAAQAAHLAVSGGWFRALPPSVPSGGYFMLRNNSSKTATLVNVTSPACTAMMMHKTSSVGIM